MSSNLHPTAIIDAQAQLDEGVCVGPYSIVGPQVKIGKGTVVGAHSVIEGDTQIGCDNKIGHFVSLGGVPQDMKYRAEPTRLVIGARNTIREFVTIHIGTIQDRGLTQIGDDNWIMAYVHIAHDCRIGAHTVFSNNVQIAGHVQVGDWAVLGGMLGVHQFVHIGAHAMLGGALALRQDVPPFVLVGPGKRGKPIPLGVNSEGLKRRGFSQQLLSVLNEAYKILYQKDLSYPQAQVQLQQLMLQNCAQKDQLTILLDFLAASTRGIIR